MAETLPFLDTNILLRHLLNDVPAQSPRATVYLARIENGELRARTADSVIMETVFTLQRQYKIPKGRVRELLSPIINLPGIVLPGKDRLQKVLDLYVQYNISFIDAYHAVLMQRLGIGEIVTFDTDFDKIAGVSRIEP